jgi:hypothetical protein
VLEGPSQEGGEQSSCAMEVALLYTTSIYRRTTGFQFCLIATSNASSLPVMTSGKRNVEN